MGAATAAAAAAADAAGATERADHDARLACKTYRPRADYSNPPADL